MQIMHGIAPTVRDYEPHFGQAKSGALLTNLTAGTIVTAKKLGAISLRCLGAAAVCILLAAALPACTSGDENSAWEKRLREVEEQTRSLDTRVQEPEGSISNLESFVSVKEHRSRDKDGPASVPEGTALEWIAGVAEDSGGQVYYIEHPEREDRTILVVPLEFVDGETPLIVSLHGYGGNSADHATDLPLHERVNTDGFALLLPNGTFDGEGNRFWNPSDRCCQYGKTGEDDVSYLTYLVEGVREVRDFGAVYFFGYSNGGFMAYHIACKGLPGLRAVASLAGTSYVNDSSCEDAQPVSVLHIHGTADHVILFEGDESETVQEGGQPAFYAGAHDMMRRWSLRAGCEWSEHAQPYGVFDLDRYVPGSETHAFRLEAGCAEGIEIELWKGEGSSHAPDYGDSFIDALVDWLLSQEQLPDSAG